jgi:hypothetical protein
MFNETHELVHEFPEMKDRIRELKAENAHFAKLYNEYHAVTERVSRMEKEVETVSDTVMEQAKKERLALKDQLFAMLKDEAA